MAELTPADLRHLAAIVKAEREVYELVKAAYAEWLPQLLNVVLDDVTIVAGIDPDRAGRAQEAWNRAIEPVVAALTRLWKLRYNRKGKNKRRRDSGAARYAATQRERLQAINKGAVDMAQDVVTNYRNSGATDAEIRVALEEGAQPERYDDAAARISRTSVMSAYNGGAEAGYVELAELTGQAFTKTWRAIFDGRTRETHAEASGQTVDIGKPFEVGGFFCNHPGDDSLPVWEAANCRCISEFRLAGIVAAIGGKPMSWSVERSAGRSDYAEWVVVRDDNGEIVGEHATKAMAFIQLRALGEATNLDDTPTADEAAPVVDDQSPVIAAVSELATGWRGPIAALDRLTGDSRWLATPPDGLRTREYPMSVTRKHVGDDEIFIGNIHDAWIQDGMLWGEGSFDLEGEDGREASRLVSNRLLFTMSIDPDQVTGEANLVDADGNLAPADILEEAINTGLIPDGYRQITMFTDWRLSSVALVAIPAYDEARIEPVFDYVAPNYSAPVFNDSSMIALRPVAPEQFAVEGGLNAEDLHVTLRYLGKVAGIENRLLPGLHAAAHAASQALGRKRRARVAGYGQLGDEGAIVLFLNGADISDAHDAVATALTGDDYCMLPEPHRPFLAHMTIGYGVEASVAAGFVGREFDFASASLDFGPIRTDYPAAQPDPEPTVQEGIVASAKMGGQIFHREFFEAKATGPTELTVDENGHIYGHVRLYGTCYQYGGGQGDGGFCVEPPLSACGYEKFHRHGAKMDDGTIWGVGALTYGEGHESRGGLQASVEHYNHVSTIAAKVFATEDEWGVWITGEVCSDHADRAYDLLLSPMSGHWEPDADNGNHLEMLAAHIVVTPGYNVRGQRRIVASFDQNREAVRLVVPSPWRQERNAEVTQFDVKVERKLGMADFRRAEELRARIAKP